MRGNEAVKRWSEEPSCVATGAMQPEREREGERERGGATVNKKEKKRECEKGRKE